MAAHNKFQDTIRSFLEKEQNCDGTDTAMVYLTNNTPSASADSVLADLAGITEQNGYAAADILNTGSETAGTYTVAATDKTWTASGGSFGPFRYIAIYNDTPTSPADPLWCWWDYGSSITVLTAESFTADFAPNIFTAT